MESTIRLYADDCVIYRKIIKKGRHGYFVERPRQSGGMSDLKCYEDKSK
jgi:hypothetical protein